MSFFDNFAANLNSNKSFFSQVDMAKNARQNFLNEGQTQTREKPEQEASIEAATQENTKINKEEKNFFKAAKNIFTDYKKKADKKETGTDLEDELEDANETLNLIFQTATQPIIEQELALAETQASSVEEPAVGLDLIEHRPEVNPDPELLDFFLAKVENQVNSEIETLTKKIVSLDLSTQDGVKDIINLSNQVEKLQNLEANIKEFTEKLEAIELEDQDSLKPEIKSLIENKVQTKIEEIKNLDLQEIKAKIDTSKETKDIKAILDEIKANLKQTESQKSTEFHVKVLKEAEFKPESNRKMDFSTADIEILEIEETQTEKQEKGFDFTNDNFETLFPKEIKASDVKIKTLSKPVAIKQLPELIQKETGNMKANSRQEVKMILDPENLGRLQLNITKEDNQIHISMLVRTDEAATKLEQKINDIRTALKDKGFEANIEVNKSDADNSSQSQQSGKNESNEARDEQKEKYLNQIPEWISEDIKNLSFEEALEQII